VLAPRLDPFVVELGDEGPKGAMGMELDELVPLKGEGGFNSDELEPEGRLGWGILFDEWRG
jgi:hypothetical protein